MATQATTGAIQIGSDKSAHAESYNADRYSYPEEKLT